MESCKYPKMENVRTFHIQAIKIPIVYNRYGDYDPDGLLYVLEEDAERIRREALERFKMDIPQPYKEVQPLVIRANLGDTVKVRFQNSLDRRLSIHVQGLSYDVNTSDGANVTEKYGAGDYLYYFGGIDDA
ncbi:MAG: multicopper oxidase domain-containing protein [Ruminococcus sp.]|nr:multicopper oxidase domain-containing protein [Ruminococcus sp.]